VRLCPARLCCPISALFTYVVNIILNATRSVELLERCDTVVGICVNDWSELVADSHGLQVRNFLQIDERLVAGDSLRLSPEAVLTSGYLADTLDEFIKKLEDCMHRSRIDRKVSVVDFGKLVIHEPGSGDDVWSELGKKSYAKATGTPSTFMNGRELSTCPDIRSEVSVVFLGAVIEMIDLALFKQIYLPGRCMQEYCHPGVFFKVMGDYLDEDAVVCADIGDNALWLASAMPAKRGQRFLTVSASGGENQTSIMEASSLS